jgi:hypothetical protein
METGKPPGRTSGLQLGLVVLTTISLLVCPLAWGAQAAIQVAFAGQPFTTLVPVQATFTPPVGSPIPTTIPIPTLGPGQSFTADNKPDLISKLGDDEFGYGKIAGKPGLYLMWVTDERGTHYFTVDGTDQQFNSGETADDFTDFIGQREEKRLQIEEKQAEIDIHRNKRWTSDGVGLLIIGFGALVCGIVTGGACFAPFAVGALTAVGNAVAENSAAQSLQPSLEALQGDLDQIDANLSGTFMAMGGSTTNP